jgi:tetratricopeptide (TPR) repeat protein
MPRALPSPTAVLTACGLLAILTGCSSSKSDPESASASTTATGAAAATEMAAGTGVSSKTVSLTTSSAEARDLYLKGRTLAEQLRAQDGRKLFEQAVASDPSFAMAHYQLAVTSATAKDFFTHMKHAVSLSDKASEGERLMIRILEANGNAKPKQGLEYTEELVAKFPGDERAHFLLGTAYFARQEYDRAIAEYQRSIAINPTFSGAYNLMGYAYRSVEKYDDAEQAFKKYIDLIPNDPNPYDSYAELLMKTGRFDESIAQYRKALSLDPHFGNSHIGIATNLMLQGKHDAAAAEAHKLYDAARDDGDRRFALFARSVIYVDGGRTREALAEAEKEYGIAAARGDSANMSADELLIGNILLAAGRPAEAAKRFQHSLEVVEKSSLSSDVKEDAKLAAHLNGGRVALAKGDLATAKQEQAAYASGAEERHNTFRTRGAHELAGNIALKEKKFDAAIAELAQGNQQDPQVLYTTALAYKGKGDAAKAKEFAGRAANFNVLPLLTYAFVRAEAKGFQAGQ